MQPLPDDPLGPAFRAGTAAAIESFLDGQADLVARVGASPMLELARAFTGGGKRLRPAFCYWAAVAAAGPPADPAPLLRAAASLDLLHVSALVHDDLIDASDTRRGVPAAHRQFAARHKAASGRGDANAYGASAAILLGDLLLVWSCELFERSGVDAAALAAARPVLDAMRTEVTCGQYLDVSAAHGVAGAGSPAEELAIARRVLEFKSASYSVRRPAQAGAALAGADDALIAALGDFGSPLGAAFQLRDDILGVFGDPETTGKPRGDDIREGKRTILVLTALEGADEPRRATLSGLLGNEHLTPDEVDVACRIIEEVGARAAVEDLIGARTKQALAALDTVDMHPEGRLALTRLTELSVQRDR